MIFTGNIPFEPKPSDNIAWQSDTVISSHRLGQGHLPGYYTACSTQKSFIPDPLCWVCQTGALKINEIKWPHYYQIQRECLGKKWQVKRIKRQFGGNWGFPLMLRSSCCSLERKLCSIKSSVMNKTPNQIQTQINGDVLGFHLGLASLLHQVPCVSLGCRPRLHSACATAISLLLLPGQLVCPSLPGASSINGKPGRWGTWKPPPNKNDRMD